MNWWMGHNKKNSRKCHEIKRILTLTLSKTSLKNTKEKDFFTAIHNHLTLALA